MFFSTKGPKKSSGDAVIPVQVVPPDVEKDVLPNNLVDGVPADVPADVIEDESTNFVGVVPADEVDVKPSVEGGVFEKISIISKEVKNYNCRTAGFCVLDQKA